MNQRPPVAPAGQLTTAVRSETAPAERIFAGQGWATCRQGDHPAFDMHNRWLFLAIGSVEAIYDSRARAISSKTNDETADPNRMHCMHITDSWQSYSWHNVTSLSGSRSAITVASMQVLAL
jgi:hypothetical protein